MNIMNQLECFYQLFLLISFFKLYNSLLINLVLLGSVFLALDFNVSSDPDTVLLLRTMGVEFIVICLCAFQYGYIFLYIYL